MTKKILIVTDNLPDQINGVVTTYKNIEACAILDGCTVDYIDPRRFRYIDCPCYNEVKLTLPWKVGKEIEKIDPDYIHIATEGPIGLWARAYLTRHNIKYNTAYHTKFPEGLAKLFGIPEFLTWKYVRWFHKHSGKVLTTTETMKKCLLDQKFKNNIVSWTRGVDRDIFNPSYRGKTVAGKPILLCVSRVSKEKNLEKFFELDYPGATKIMVGDGPMLQSYKKQYTDVVFTGFKVGKELAEYYANADVFVFPSVWETFGIVMIESMSCGTPVAAFPCQGPKDVIDEGVTGYTNDNLKQAIDQCLKLNRRKVLKGSQRWSWEHTWLMFKNNLINIK
jgi:glycosyltransferase involved in cell wall biosynthesis